jgi:fatty-acyl-CoA synthase
MEIINRTIGELIDYYSEVQPERECLVFPERKLRYTYRQFQQECNIVASGFMKLGVKKGDHVAIWCTNLPEWVICQFALPKIGAVLITVNTHYRRYELEYLLRQSDATTLVLMDSFRDASYVEMLYNLCPDLEKASPGTITCERFPYLKNLVYLGEGKRPGMYTWEELRSLGKKVPPDELQKRQQTVNPEDTAILMYTSGTTGFPKGAMLTHSNLVMDGYYIGESMNLGVEDRMCIPVPFFHCFGSVLGNLASVTHGGTMIPIEQFNSQIVLETVEEERCTALHGVPTMFIAELEEMKVRRYDLSSLRTGIMAGSPCPIELMKAVTKQMGIRELTVAYGQTEASPVITQTRTNDPIELRVSTVGRPLPGVEVKIVDPETGEKLPPGIQGELCTRGFLVMKGYYKMPKATAEVIDQEGWLHTGDLAIETTDGYYKITGRVKEMIIRGGENIYPREIEEFLYTNPNVLDVQVIGVPSRKYGEEAAACIRLRGEITATEEEFREFCRGKISRFKIPKYFVFMDSYPMTASGKIQKYKLRQIMIKRLGLEHELIETV